MYRFRECREAAGISQKSAAITVGVKPPSMSDWESGRTNPTCDKLVKLAELYGVTVDALLGLSDEENFHISQQEKAVLVAYRKATPDTRRAARAVLGVPEAEEKSTAI